MRPAPCHEDKLRLRRKRIGYGVCGGSSSCIGHVRRTEIGDKRPLPFVTSHGVVNLLDRISQDIVRLRVTRSTELMDMEQNSAKVGVVCSSSKEDHFMGRLLYKSSSEALDEDEFANCQDDDEFQDVQISGVQSDIVSPADGSGISRNAGDAFPAGSSMLVIPSVSQTLQSSTPASNFFLDERTGRAKVSCRHEVPVVQHVLGAVCAPRPQSLCALPSPLID